MAMFSLPVLFYKTLISLHDDDDRRTDTSSPHAFAIVYEELRKEGKYQIGSKIDYIHAREQIETSKVGVNCENRTLVPIDVHLREKVIESISN